MPEFRTRFSDCFDAVVPKIAEIDHPLIRLALTTYLDPKQKKEQALLEKIAIETDPQKDPVAIKRLAKLKIAKVNKVLRNRSLPKELQAYLKKK